MFIEDFPESDSINDAEEAIGSLRLKLARKDYETGRIYLKLEEYESALVYFQSVMNQYYDTGVSDDARIGIIFTHILNDNHKGAHSYLHSQTGKFLSEDKYNEAETLLQDTEMGLKLAQYYQLYR
jgi:outer membrane protein assembly factor BamD